MFFRMHKLKKLYVWKKKLFPHVEMAVHVQFLYMRHSTHTLLLILIILLAGAAMLTKCAHKCWWKLLMHFIYLLCVIKLFFNCLNCLVFVCLMPTVLLLGLLILLRSQWSNGSYGSPHSFFLSSTLRILPLTVLGSWSTNSICHKTGISFIKQTPTKNCRILYAQYSSFCLFTPPQCFNFSFKSSGSFILFLK